jgi:hypothetical protein
LIVEQPAVDAAELLANAAKKNTAPPRENGSTEEVA